MSLVSGPVMSTTARAVALTVRPDLKFERQVYQGEVSWVVKDPVGLKYYRLPEEEYAVLMLLDGETTLDTIKAEIERTFAPIIIEFSELQSLLGMFHQYGLVISLTEGQGEQLFRRRRKVRRQQMMGKLASVLWIRLPGFDPERILNWMYPKVKWFFTRWCFVLCTMASLSAMLLVTINIETFYRKLPHFHEFFSFPNMIWMMVAMGVAKIIHEFGHGLTCKHYGGECHEIGLMFLVFTPCLYCDTSDSWMLKSKWQRAAIGAGGMYVEVIMAAIATFIWWNTEEGMLHFLALSTMFVCSVSTVIFNSNPLLRYDGYYILSDILEVPNLSQKSRNALLGLLRHYCLGMPWNEQQMALPPRNRVWFALYSVASTVYRWMVLIFILMFLTKVFEPYGLEAIGHIFIAMSLFGIVVVPMWKSFKFFRVPGRMRQVKKIRLLITVTLAAGLIAAIALIPVPHRVITTLVVQPRDAEAVYVSIPGDRNEVLDLEPGDQVTKGTPLTALTNRAMDREVLRLEDRKKYLDLQVAVNELMSPDLSVDANAESVIARTKSMRDSVEKELAKRKSEQARLTLVAPISGHILAPPDLPAQPEDENLPNWSGSPWDKQNQGCLLDTGTLFCMIGDPDKMEVVMIIDQSDMEFVKIGQKVDIKLDEYPNEVISSTIAEIAKIDLKYAPRELGTEAQGELTTKRDASGKEKPMSASYQARVLIHEFDGKLLQGFRGRAKIHTGSRTLGQMLVRYLLKTFRFG